MARPRKNAVKDQSSLLTPDNVVEIPVEEQPYPLPEGWKWVRLEHLYQINPKVVADDNTMASFIPMEKIEPGMRGAFTFEVLPWGKIKKGHTQFADGDVAFAKISPCFENGKSMLVHGLKNGIGAGTTELVILRQSSIIQKYTFYLICSYDFIQKGRNTYSGTVGQQRINMDFVRNYPIPLPPIEEQQRIVDCIESLFAKLDEAREKAEAVRDGFESRKAALLHKAFTGELTEKWRENRGISKSTWMLLPFSQVAEIKSNLVDPAKFQKFPHIAPDNIEKKTGRLLEYHTIAEDKVTSGKHRFYPGQILYSKIRPYLSKVVVIDFDGLCSADMYPIEAKENTKYLWYYMLSEDFLEQASSAGSRSVLPKINQKELSRIVIRRPSLSEQNEIVRILDTLLEKERQVKEAAEDVLEHIDLMKKAILAKAFRGELTR